MATPYAGQLGWLGIGYESSSLEGTTGWGTFRTPGTWLEITEANLEMQRNPDDRDSVRGAWGRRHVVLGSKWARGPVQGLVSAQRMGELLFAAFGAVTTTATKASSAGGYPAVYTHVFKRRSGLSLPAYTAHENLGGAFCKRTTGVRLNQLTIRQPRGAAAEWEADLVGKTQDKILTTALPAATFATDEFLHHNGFSAKVADYGSALAAWTVPESFEIRITNNLEEGIVTAGSAGALGTLPAAAFTVDGTISLGLEGSDDYDDWLTDQYRLLQLKIEGDAIGPWTEKYTLQIDIFRTRWSRCNPGLTAGRLTHDLEFMSVIDDNETDDAECKVTLINSVANFYG
jgi:hypothetical protein